MKKLILSFLLISIMSIGLYAQDAAKDLKKATRNLGSYLLDESANADKLSQAKDLINSALKSDEIASTAKAWIAKGQIYNELANADTKKKILDENYTLMNPEAAVGAFEAYSKALTLAQKKFERKDIMKGLGENESHLNNAAISLFGLKDYAGAFGNFSNAMKLYDLLKENGATSRLDDKVVYEEQVFYTAVSGYYGDQAEASMPFFEKALKNEKVDPFCYDALYNHYATTDKTKAYKYLTEGREKFPDDTGLLYAEINYMVAEGKLEELIDKLKVAIEREPDNLSIYTTLGSVYDNLHAKAREENNSAKTGEYFDLAMDWYNKALAKMEIILMRTTA